MTIVHTEDMTEQKGLTAVSRRIKRRMIRSAGSYTRDFVVSDGQTQGQSGDSRKNESKGK